ncbi:hypothetical protein OSB04_018229 [Centaurea solstitialis]|uniref:Uncharacterized protein n=1 Tax=Centaurea solstitialis TaxID=347529 RepID=A0AA38T635_9ASTR|nr:hypothetical protein OSB04_018229 [Centaurea solstitialis]
MEVNEMKVLAGREFKSNYMSFASAPLQLCIILPQFLLQLLTIYILKFLSSQHKNKERKLGAMGRKLDALLGRKFKTSKFKTTLNLAISRLSLLKNQRNSRYTIARSDIVQLLLLNHHEHALLRGSYFRRNYPSGSQVQTKIMVEQVIKDQNMLDIYDMIHVDCHLLIQRINLIERANDCPSELEEAVSNLLYAAPRCGEFPELQEIRAILTSRFGKEFAYVAIELRSNCRVSQKMIEKLSPKQSSLESRMKMLLGIATENGIVLQLEESSPEIRKEEWVVDKKRNQLNTEAKVEEEVAATGLPEKIEKILSFSESMKGRKEYRDVADAAQDAFESAAYAAAAARAAVKLSRLESFNSAKKVLNSESMKSKLHMHDRNRMGCHDSESENDEIDEGERSRYDMKVAEFDGSDSDDYSDEGDIRPLHGGQSKPFEKMYF